MRRPAAAWLSGSPAICRCTRSSARARRAKPGTGRYRACPSSRMRKIANAIDSAPKVSAAITSAFDSAYRPMPKKSAAVQKTRIAIRTHDTGPLAICSDISKRDCSTMLAYWLRGRQRRFLRVRRGFERREKVADRLRVGEAAPRRSRARDRRPAAPDRVVAFLDSLLDLVAQRLGLGTVLRQRLIEPQTSGRRSFRGWFSDPKNKPS